MGRIPSSSGRRSKGCGGNSQTPGRFPGAGFAEAPIRATFPETWFLFLPILLVLRLQGQPCSVPPHHEIRFVEAMACPQRGDAPLRKITLLRRLERLVVRPSHCSSTGRPALQRASPHHLRHRMPKSRFRWRHSHPGSRLIHNRLAGSCSRTRRGYLCPPCRPSGLEGLADRRAPLRPAVRVLPADPAVPVLLAAPAGRPRPLHPVGPEGRHPPLTLVDRAVPAGPVDRP